MKKENFSGKTAPALAAVLIMTACMLLSGCGGEPGGEGNPAPTLQDKAFEVFKNFEAENYTPPKGFDTFKSAGGAKKGTVVVQPYISKSTGNPEGVERLCSVFLPPDYDENETYPVLYLLHGIDGTHTEWVSGYSQNGLQSKLVDILSNVINSGDAKPMIVVIPNARAMIPDGKPANNSTAQIYVDAFHNFINDLKNDLMPFIKETYKISEARDQQALAGLSMGGMETMHISYRMYETFGYFGAFSVAPVPLPLTAEQQKIPDDYKNKTFYMLCCGTADTTGLSTTRGHVNTLKNNGMEPAYYEIEGGTHDFVRVWNEALYYFAQCIFQ